MFWGYSSVGGLKLCPLKTYLIIMGYRSKSALSTLLPCSGLAFMVLALPTLTKSKYVPCS
jgi:hypothetical protein